MKNTKQIAAAGVISALVFVATYFIRIPIPNGYLNLGDAVILISTLMLGPFAAIPAAIGAGLADLISGYSVYVIPTVIIKALMGLTAGRILSHERSVARRITGFLLAEMIMVAGYFAFEALPFMYGPEAAWVDVPLNAIQGAAAIAVALPASFAGPFKKKL
ncbi:MAG: ECF transporter S component [Saccharofermentans sp.]|nr:ECF transporter S component [Saccharofermentans sp.]